MATCQVFNFLALAGELRNEIYCWVLLDAAQNDIIILPSGTCVEGFRLFSSGRAPTPILDVSRAMYEEVLPVLCANFHVRFMSFAAIDRVPPKLAATIQHASMRLSAEVDHQGDLKDASASRCCLEGRDVQSECQSLLSRLCNLRSLEVLILVQVSDNFIELMGRAEGIENRYFLPCLKVSQNLVGCLTGPFTVPSKIEETRVSMQILNDRRSNAFLHEVTRGVEIEFRKKHADTKPNVDFYWIRNRHPPGRVVDGGIIKTDEHEAAP